jgi:hypothetical protein
MKKSKISVTNAVLCPEGKRNYVRPNVEVVGMDNETTILAGSVTSTKYDYGQDTDTEDNWSQDNI